MQVVTRRKRISAVDLRARVPAIARGLALFLLVGGVIFVGVSYYKMRHNTPFRMRSETPALSKEITGIIEGYERRMTKGDRLYLWLRAARDVSYADGHHELEQVNLQVFPPTGDKPDQIPSNQAIDDQKKGAGQFTGNVQIETHEALKVKTDSLVYHQDNEVAETSSPITFERENVSGKATGALVDDKNKGLELRNDVEVTVAPEALKDPNKKDTKPLKGARAKPVTIHSAQAVFEQTSMRLTFSGGATAEQEQDVMSGDTLTAILSDQKKLEKIEMRGNSYLRAMDEGHAAEAHSVDMDFSFDGDQRLQRAYGSRDIRTQTLNADSDPFQPSAKRGTRTLTSQKMAALFVRETQDVDRVDATGDAKFNEMDRNGIANSVSYTAADETVRLRGGEPTVWDSRARTKAMEIDSNNATDISYCRSKVQTTYYSQEQTNGAAPFRKVKSPVYLLADRAEVNHDSGVAIYTGNSRMWQDDNFVRADTITLFREEKRMDARGHVQSALYQAKQKTGNSTAVVPVFATAEFMRYSDPDRLLHYETNVDIKQGTDRMTSGVADVYLQKNVNEVERTIAQHNVVIIQPGKRGTGDWCQYTNADEVAILKGNPAHVEDVEQGTTDGNRLTMYRRENRVVVDDNRGEQSPGRVRPTHKVNKNP